MPDPAASPRPASLAERLGELEKGVTEGPWVQSPGGVGTPEQEAAICGMPWSNRPAQKAEFRANAAFIARSRNLWPLLAEVVEALDEVHEWECGCDCPGSTAKCVARPEGTFAVLARLAAALDEEGQR